MKDRIKYKVRTGFTMIELMAVLIIMGLLFAVVVRNFSGKVDEARRRTTIASLKLLHGAVQQFKMDTGQYPSEEMGLTELIEEPADLVGWQPGGYLETTELPVDGWGQDFIYERYPESGKEFVIKSFGADKTEGGEGLDADLLSTDAL